MFFWVNSVHVRRLVAAILENMNQLFFFTFIFSFFLKKKKNGNRKWCK